LHLYVIDSNIKEETLIETITILDAKDYQVRAEGLWIEYARSSMDLFPP